MPDATGLVVGEEVVTVVEETGVVVVANVVDVDVVDPDVVDVDVIDVDVVDPDVVDVEVEEVVGVVVVVASAGRNAITNPATASISAGESTPPKAGMAEPPFEI